MTDLKFTNEDAREAFFNIGKLCGRISSDEGKRLAMLIQIIASYTEQLAEENDKLKNGDDFDLDGRC
jgi:hypothetical protein